MKFKEKVIKEYQKKGYKVVSIVKTSENGFPDLMLLKEGKAMFIEIKSLNDTLKPLQQYKIDELNKIGFEAFTLHEIKGIIKTNIDEIDF